MQINEKKVFFIKAISQYSKIFGGLDHCFMCDIIKCRNTQIPSVFFPTSFVWETSHFINNKK